MKFQNQKSVQDFTGLALPKDQLKNVKGGNNSATDAAALDWIIIDDLVAD